MTAIEESIIEYLINQKTINKKVFADTMFLQFILIESDSGVTSIVELKDYISNNEIPVDKLSDFFNFPKLTSTVAAVLLEHIPTTHIEGKINIDESAVKKRVSDFLDKLEKHNIWYIDYIIKNKDWFIKLNLNKYHYSM